MRADLYYEQYVRLSPPAGQVPLGGAHFDAYVRWYALNEFLRRLDAGASPSSCYDCARRDVVEVVKDWNRKPRCACVNSGYEAQRWEGMTDGILLWAMQLAQRDLDAAKLEAKP